MKRIILITFLVGMCVAMNVAVFTAIEINHRETKPQTWSRAVANKSGSYVTGAFAQNAFSPSVRLGQRLSYRTCGEWEGAIVPETWSEHSDKWIPNFSKAHFSNYSLARKKPMKNGNIHYSIYLKNKHLYRLRMWNYKSGECNYELWGN